VSKVTAINAVHSTGFRVLDWSKPIPQLEGELYDKAAEENVTIEGDEVTFPITPYNYRMIVFQAPKPPPGMIEIKKK
jgi:hypothetical protein